MYCVLNTAQKLNYLTRSILSQREQLKSKENSLCLKIKLIESPSRINRKLKFRNKIISGLPYRLRERKSRKDRRRKRLFKKLLEKLGKAKF